MTPMMTTEKSVPTMSTDMAPTNAIGYEAVRFNAVKHGILSHLTVLAHENHPEFDQLLDALIDEHKPTAITEQHLIEELAAIIWRKRRVLLAEGAAINRGLRAITQSTSGDNPITSAAPFEPGLTRQSADLPELLNLNPSELAERQRFAEEDLVATRHAAAMLEKGGVNAYKKAVRLLLEESRVWWDKQVAGKSCEATAEGLAEFIKKELEPQCVRSELETRYAPAIRTQTLGEGLQAYRLEKLNRYETHLDRKFERTLAMLLKLKQLRNA